MEILLHGRKIKIARRGDKPALTGDGRYVLGCFPGCPKEIVFVPVEELPF